MPNQTESLTDLVTPCCHIPFLPQQKHVNRKLHSHLNTPFQTSIANTHWMNKWLADSGFPSHKTQFTESSGGRTCLCRKLTFVGILSWNNFQEKATETVVSASINTSNFLYIDFTMKTPLPSILHQQISSSTEPLKLSKSSNNSVSNSFSQTKRGPPNKGPIGIRCVDRPHLSNHRLFLVRKQEEFRIFLPGTKYLPSKLRPKN